MAASVSQDELHEALLHEEADEQQMPQQQSNEELNYAGSAPAATTGWTRNKRILLAFVAFAAVAAVVGAVAGTQARTSTSNNNNNGAASSASYSIIRPLFSTYNTYSALLGGVYLAVDPTVYAQDAATTSASFSVSHSTVNDTTGAISHTRLEYDVKRNNKAVIVNEHKSVLAVACSINEIAFLFNSSEVAAEHTLIMGVGSVVVLDPNWGIHCGGQIRKFVSAPVVRDSFMYASTVNGSLGDVFESGRVRFSSNHSTAGPGMSQKLSPFVPSSSSSSNTNTQRHRRGWFDTIANVVSGVVTGDYSNSWPFTSSYTMPAQTLSFSSSDDVSLSGYTTLNAGYTITTTLSLDIESYAIQSASATATIDADATMEVSLSTTTAISQQQPPTQLTQASLSSGSINVFGVSITVGLSLATFGGYNLNLNQGGEASGSIAVTGQGVVGMQYSADNGFSPAVSTNFQATPNIPQPTFNAQSQITASLLTEVAVSATYVGSTTGTVNLYSDLNGVVNPNSGCVNANVDAGAQVQVENSISINLLGIPVVSDNTPLETVYGPTLFFQQSIGTPC